MEVAPIYFKQPVVGIRFRLMHVQTLQGSLDSVDETLVHLSKSLGQRRYMRNLYKRNHIFFLLYAVTIMLMAGTLRQLLGRNNNKYLANAFTTLLGQRYRSRCRFARPQDLPTVAKSTSHVRYCTALSSSSSPSSLEDSSGKDSATSCTPNSSDTNKIIFYIQTPEDMEDLGGLLATLTVAPTAIFLDGDLGAGKTALSRGFLRTAMSDPDLLVTSPTYLLSNVYPAPECTVYHMDLYRLAQKDGVDEIKELLRPLNLDQVFANDVTLLEWPERLGPAYKQRNSQKPDETKMWPVLPPERLEVDIRINQQSRGSTAKGEEEEDDSIVDIQSRVVTLTAVGKQWMNALQEAIVEGFVDDFLYPDEDDDEE
eukprot:scaffold7485_cov176-Amphora_coffeaeformis.AAC.7